MRNTSLISKLIAFLAVFQPAHALPAESTGEYVIVLHGIFLGSWHMRPLVRYLEEEGYEVINIGYPSTRYPVEELINLTQHDIQTKLTDKTRIVHFVGYSMGGLLVRGILTQYRPEHLGRVVQIATPNHGSEVADFWKNNFLYKKLYGPAGQQLTTNADNTALFGPIDYELGIIAGNATIDPFSSFLVPGENDGKVSVESTKLEGMKDHTVVSASHFFFPRNKTMQGQVLSFLKEGSFK